MSVPVAVIGTAGRDSGAGSHKQLDAVAFRKMCDAAVRVMVEEWKLDVNKVTLVSGGSAWSDHVAVDLFLNNPLFTHSKLVLYLPCKFINGHFADEQAWHTCGKTLNQLHKQFSDKLGRSTLGDLELAVKRGATLDSTGRGFFARNLKVGKVAHYMIAFSAASGNQPSDGGTVHTWRNATTPPTNRKHISLSSIIPPPPVSKPTITTTTITTISGKKHKLETTSSNDEKKSNKRPTTDEVVKIDV
jgi:hypothetical protein